MTDAEQWEARLATVRQQIAPALAMVGIWEGDGQAHGAPITGSLHVRAILGGTAVEVWERVGDHEDLSLYRFEPEDGQIRVLHAMEGQFTEHPVELLPGALVWVTPPSQPSVVWTLAGAELVCEVVWPGQRVPEVSLRYRRV